MVEACILSVHELCCGFPQSTNTYTTLQAAIAAIVQCRNDSIGIVSDTVTPGSIVLDVAENLISVASERRHTLVSYILKPVGVDAYGKAGHSR